MKGAFIVSRDIFENSIWDDVQKFRIFLFILGNAVFKEEGVRKGSVFIGRGQYLRSYRNLQRDLEYLDNRTIKQYSLSTIKRKISKLVEEERLKIEETELGTLFTVVNYDRYQVLDNYKSELGTALEQQENTNETPKEQRGNNNKYVKKGKNVKNDKNIYIYSSIIQYLNQKAGTSFKASSKATQRLIDARLNEEFSVDDFKKVIDNKVTDANNPKDLFDVKYLRPQTLFGTKFEGYLNQKSKYQPREENKNGWPEF